MNVPFDLFRLEALSIFVAKGDATYTMNRGTFSTRDRIRKKTSLTYKKTEEGIYWYESTLGNLGVQPVWKENRLELKILNETSANRFWFEMASTKEEHFYGCGEQFTEFDLKGKTVPIWVSEHHSLKKLLMKFLREKVFGVNPNHRGKFKHQQTYHAQPTFLSSRKYVFHADSTCYQRYSFLKEKTVLFFRSVPSTLNILHADSFLALSTEVSKLLGFQPRLPEWTGQGLIIASQRGIDSLWEKVRKAQEAGVVLAGVWSQDWSGNVITAFGYQVYWNWVANNTLYPNLREEIKSLDKEKIAFLGYINTFLKEDTPLYNEAKALGYFVQTQEKDVYKIKSTTFSAGIIDLTNPKAVSWYKQVIQREMISTGMKGWMADFGEYLPTDAVVFEGDPTVLHNQWPSLWAKLNQEAIVESDRKDELFFFTRAGYTETIRSSPATWAGDQHVDFSKEYGLPSAILSALSMAVIGIGITHSDIGGYTTVLHMRRSKELLIRWAEMNVFSPLFRCHEGNAPEKNVQFDHDEETLAHFAKLSRFFVGLAPYTSFLKEEYYALGHPLIRPVFFHHDEPWAYRTNYCYMYGDDVFVSPVLTPKTTSMNIRLPEGTWIRFMTHESYSGGFHTIKTPLGTVVAFYRADSTFKALFDALGGSVDNKIPT